MGLGALAVRVSAVADSLRRVTAESRQAATATREVLSIREQLSAGRDARTASTYESLISGPATTAAMSMYVETAAVNPNDPRLNQIKNFLRQFAKVDESFFTQVDQMFKAARRAFDKDRANRGKRLEQNMIDDIIDELSGRS